MKRHVRAGFVVLLGFALGLPLVSTAFGQSGQSHDPSGASLLLQAAAQGDAVSLRRLLAEGVPATAADPERGFTALHNASAMGHVAFVDRLLGAGAHVDATDRNGVTALISAAYHGHTEVVQQLLAHGADANHRPQAGPTALAAALDAGSKPTLNALLAAGADPAQADAFGVTAYEVAARTRRQDLLAALPTPGAASHD